MPPHQATVCLLAAQALPGTGLFPVPIEALWARVAGFLPLLPHDSVSMGNNARSLPHDMQCNGYAGTLLCTVLIFCVECFPKNPPSLHVVFLPDDTFFNTGVKPPRWVLKPPLTNVLSKPSQSVYSYEGRACCLFGWIQKHPAFQFVPLQRLGLFDYFFNGCSYKNKCYQFWNILLGTDKKSFMHFCFLYSFYNVVLVDYAPIEA